MIPILIALATIAYAGSIIAFGRGPLYLNSNIFGAIVNFVGALAPIGLFLLVNQQRHAASGNTKIGITWALFGGVCIAVFTIALAFIFSKGKNVSFVTPLIYGGAVLIASTIGIIFFKEKVNNLQLIGLLLIVSGILSIAVSSWKAGGAS